MSRQSVYVTTAEWRWVIVIGCGLLLLAFAPLLWVAIRGTPGWQFMGVLHNYLDGSTYLSKMTLGQSGEWMVSFMHTAEPHSGAVIQVIYLALGHLSRVTGIPPVILFHVARVAASLLMYTSIYQLGATIWTRVRARRVFFGIASVGAGLGWLFSPLTQRVDYPDFPLLPEAFPFYSTLMNVHFPLTIACLALLATFFLIVFRPGSDSDPTIDIAWPVAGLISIGIAFLYPQALVPFCAAICLYAGTLFLRTRRIPVRTLRWILATILPVIPIAVYIYAIVSYNPAMQIWNSQNVTAAPDPLTFAIGFAGPLLIGLPALFRAIRRFERDGDRFMLLWIIAILISVYLPTNIQRRFAVGIMLPLAYFATRAIEDVWIRYVSRRFRLVVGIVFFFFIGLSQWMMLFLPALPAVAGDTGRSLGVFLPSDYLVAYNWINQQATIDDVILAAPVPGAWAPGWGGVRTVYGHPYETLNAEQRLAEVNAWYAGEGDCRTLLETFDVRFVIAGPQEALITGDGESCADQLNLPIIAETDTVTIYAP